VTAETALAAPLVMLILLTITQFALWSHATHIAQTAAAQGLAVTRAHTTLTQLADGPLRDATVHATRTDTTARVEVNGTAASVLPFLHLPVHAETQGPVERFLPDTTEIAER
jgi:hypothetical protein